MPSPRRVVPSSRPRRRIARQAARVESLERRRLLHAVLNTSTHILTATGVAGTVNDTISITDDGTNIVVNHVNDATSQSFARDGVVGIVVNALDGDDVVTVTGANIVSCTINAGNGNDSITAAGGRDAINGGMGNDTISGGANDDVIDAGDGNDSVMGGLGNDSLSGGTGTNTLVGGQGTDVVSEVTDKDAFVSDTQLQYDRFLADTDSISTIENVVVSSGGAEFDPHVLDARLFTLGPVTLVGGEGDDILWGTPSGDFLDSGDGQDQVHAGDGDDLIDNGNSGAALSGLDSIDGAGGIDKLVQGGVLPNAAPFSSVITVVDQLYTASFTGADIHTHFESIEGIEVIGGGGDDTINTVGFPLSVTVRGGVGNDTITTGEGDDVIMLDRFSGSDSIDAGGGDDLLDASADVDMILGNSAITIGGAQSTFANIESAKLTNSLFDPVSFSAAGVTSMPVTLTGGTGNDTLTGGGGPTRIDGGDGNDALNGGNGGGILMGGNGDDALFVGQNNTLSSLSAPTTADGGAGTDTLTLNDTAYMGSGGFTVNDSTVSRGTRPPITYSTIEGMTLNGGGIGSKIHTVNGTAAGCPVRFNPGSAFDTFNVNATSATGPVSIAASGGGDDVNVNLDDTGTANVIFPTTFSFAQKLAELDIGEGGTATLAAGSNRVLATVVLTIDPTGKLDLSNNDLVWYYPAALQPISVPEAWIRAARNGGAWNGAGGITSTYAKNNALANTGLGTITSAEYQILSGSNTFDGLSLATPAMLVKYTYNGDANLDGRVTFDDYVRIDTGFNAHRTGWSNGDFDYSGGVNFDDYVLIDIAFNSQGSPLGRFDAAAATKRAGRATLVV